MKKILFIDRDGTIIKEPEDEQIDSFEKLSFLPGVISNLKKIYEELDYKLVMVTNQDGLGTKSFPEEQFWPVHNLMINILKSEGIHFGEVLIDRSFHREKKDTRKPEIGLLKTYITGKYDLGNSYVIGDRESDIKLAENLGCGSIYIGNTENSTATFMSTDWASIYHFLRSASLKADEHRKTAETDIYLKIDLGGHGHFGLQTGIGFFDHMLELLTRHSGFDLFGFVRGDLHVDEHHLVEDTAIVLGAVLRKALGSKKGIERYGFLLPMDESLARVAIDLSGRPELVWEADFKREKIGSMPTELFKHFFKSFSYSLGCNLHIRVEGENEHHKIEAIFKAVGRSLKQAISVSNNPAMIPSTKGNL